MFQAPKSVVEISFWEELYRQKLDQMRLESQFVDISGYLSPEENGTIRLDRSAFERSQSRVDNSIRIHGALLNVNTIEVSMLLAF